MRAENVTGPVAQHGEGPVWSRSWGCLRFVDLTEGDVLTLGEGGAVRRRHVGAIAALVRPRASGGFIVALERSLGLASEDEGEITTLPDLWRDPSVRFNDGCCSPDGALYIGSMAYDGRHGAGTLFRVEPDLAATVALTGVGVSNGMAFSPDGSAAYYVDTLTGRVDVFDYDGRGLSGRRPFVSIPAEAGLPDGLTVDADGGVWVALWGGGAVRRYSSAGHLDEVIELPITQVSACAFGGEDLDVLFITTSRHGLPNGHQQAAGSVFAARVGVLGLPVQPFTG